MKLRSIVEKRLTFFFYTPTKKFLSEVKMPIQTSPRLVLKSTSDNNASFRKHYLDLLALSPLKILSLPTGLTHQMVVDTYETFDENLERIFSENICPTYEKYTRSQKTDVFLTCFREHMVPSTWRGKVTRTEIVSHDLHLWTGTRIQIGRAMP